ncbi:hypothetical protein ACS0TY_029683 [Phlomoides rotata]
MNRQESEESDGEINPTHIEEKGECTQRENGDDDRRKGKNRHVYTRFPANSNGVAEISSMEIEDEAITVHDNEIESVNNQNAILEDGVIAIDENEERIANKNDIVTKEISDVLTNTILVEEDVSGCLIGLRRKTVEDMYKLYCSHARALGFSVRKGTTRYNTSGKLAEKYFYCSSSGHRECKQYVPNDKETKIVHITRTGCKALIRVKLQGDGCYEIINHVKGHNHELTRPEWSHLHRSERQITDDKGNAIEDMISSGMKPTDSFRYMAHDAGGEDCIGHTLRDHMNYVNRLRMEAIEGGDANSMIEILYEQASQETDFFFRIRHDNMGRLCSVFWRDSMMREDYNVYGDVVSFDTTYQTNKYNLIYGPFVGLNNHRKSIFFACAFLADEKTESFEWLFEVFKKSMGGKTPVYPLTRHRLCQWHLHQNAISRFGKLKHEKSFKDAFQKCLSGCDDELEFESCWKSMITEYDMEKNSWFARLYNLKAKWCTALNKDFFSAGMLSTQRSESTNSAIGVNAKKTTNLTEFYQLFIATLNKWRRNETQDEFKCSISIPKSRMQLTGMLKHASEVYTLTLFEIFEIEFMKCVFSQSTVLHVVDSVITYDISNDNGRDHRVLFDASKKLVSCTCKKFEECGLLCHHCLRVLNINNVCKIPQQYILKRWTKNAKSEIWDRFNTRIEGGSDNPASSVPWRHDMARKYYNFLLECQDDVEARNFLKDGYNRDVVAVKKLKSSSNSVDGEHSSSSNVVLDPIRSVTKGRRQRIKGPLQKNTKKRSINTSQSVSSNEFGTKTPNLDSFSYVFLNVGLF